MRTSINPLYLKGVFGIIGNQAKHIINLKKKPIIIAIDGHSSCGKSTLSKDLSDLLEYRHIDTGAMYRAVTLYLLDNNISLDDKDGVASALNNITIDFSREGKLNNTLLNGVNIEDKIRGLRVSNKVSEVASISAVRRFLVSQQQEMGKSKGIIMDGRDIGTVVFPNADLKIFMTASIDVRAKRRYDEMIAKGSKEDYNTIAANLAHRDHIDSTRKDSPLKKALDAKVIDSSDLNREQQLSVALQLASAIIA